MFKTFKNRIFACEEIFMDKLGTNFSERKPSAPEILKQQVCQESTYRK